MEQGIKEKKVRVYTRSDEFFRCSMQQINTARAILMRGLPGKLSKKLDWSTMQLFDASTIDSMLNERVTDIVYRVKVLGQNNYFMIVVEHKSSAERFSAWQLFRDKIRVLETCVSQNPKLKILPVVCGLLVHTGERGYTCSTNIFELFGEYKLLAYDLLTEDIPLLDFSGIEVATLRVDSQDSIVIFTLKHLKDKNILPHVDFLADLINNYPSGEGSLLYLKTVINTWMYQSKSEEPANVFFLSLANKLEGDIGEETMNMAEQLREEGRKECRAMVDQFKEEGRQEGREEARRQFAVNVLRQGDLMPERVAEIFSLPVEELLKLK